MRNIITLHLIYGIIGDGTTDDTCTPILNRLSELSFGNTQNGHLSSPSILCPNTCCTSRNEQRFRFQLGQTVKNLTGPELKRISYLAHTDLERLRTDVYQRLADARNKLNAKLTRHFPELNTNASIIDFFTDSTFYLSSSENDHDPVLFGRRLFTNIKEILDRNFTIQYPQCSEKPQDLFTIGAVNTFADTFGKVLRKTSAYWRSLNFVAEFHSSIDELIENKVQNDESCDNYVSVLYCRHCHAHHSVLPCASECLTTASRCLSDVDDIKRHVEMLVELMVIDVDSHKFGFTELDNYAVLLDGSIFNILEKEIVARQPADDALGCPNYKDRLDNDKELTGRISDRALHITKDDTNHPKSLTKKPERKLWKAYLNKPVFELDVPENLCHRHSKESFPCWDGYQIKDSEPEPDYENLPEDNEPVEFSESLKNELMALIKDLAIVIERTDKLKSMASRHSISIPTVGDIEGSAAEQLCDDEDGFCLGPHKDYEQSGDEDTEVPPLPEPVTRVPIRHASQSPRSAALSITLSPLLMIICVHYILLFL